MKSFAHLLADEHIFSKIAFSSQFPIAASCGQQSFNLGYLRSVPDLRVKIRLGKISPELCQ
jgi:hypothetical protein